MRRVAGVTLAAALLAGCTGPAAEPVPAGASSSAPGPTTSLPPTGPSPSVGTTPAESTPEPAPEVPPTPQYAATIGPITPELAARMAPSWRDGCPVPLADLRYVTLTHHGFDGEVRTGELVVHADVAEAITRVFRTLFEVGYPIRSMRLVDDFGADDDASMAADNTSAFNCRPIAGTSSWSEHAYGRAIDLNTVENPYVSSDGVFPPEGSEFAARPDLPGVIHGGDVVVRTFADAGWRWGGYWSGAKDYQHFSVSGR